MARKNVKAVKAAAVPVVEVEAVEKRGMGIDEGIILTTFLLLALAIVIVMSANNAIEIPRTTG